MDGFTERIFKIFRHRSGSSNLSGFQEFPVAVSSQMTVLDVLEKIRMEMDSSLMYRHSCHHSSCGTCACRVNGRERLTCVARVSDLEDGIITLEPLSGLPLLGDLVVDMTDFYNKIPLDFSYHKKCERAESGDSADRENSENPERFEDCIECASCYSACPVAGDGKPFLGPAAMTAYNNELVKRPEKSAALAPVINGERGQKLCERAIECSRVCPTKVAPAKHIAELRKKEL